MAPYFKQFGVKYILPCKPKGNTISKSLVSAKSKVSQKSIEFGKINSGGYLPDDILEDTLSFLENNEIEDSVVMGTLASYIFTKETLKYAAGRTYNKNKVKIFATYHPDSIFTSSRISEIFSSHLERALIFLNKDEIEHSRECTTNVYSKSEEYDINHDSVAVDIETLNHNQIDCMAISATGQDDEWDCDIVEYPNDKLNKSLSDKTLIFQNGSYDLTFMQRYMNFDLNDIKFEDTMILSRCIDPYSLSSLDDLARKYTPEWTSWKQMVKHK